ncbi:MAG: hypothetical protein NTY46_09260 [Candidatus Sumerlaeota bacterium]|nr:hypothetical protein [Candidatus Sumerlaeota bacterium]
MRSIRMSYAVLLSGACFLTSGSLCAATTHISGGGMDKISAAITATSDTPSLIIIDDSQTYTETKNIYVGPRSTAGHAVSIESAAGQTPTIVLSGISMVAYAGTNEDVHVGSASGGRISIDARSPGNPPIWYIGQSDGRTGPACKWTLENLDIDFTGWPLDCITFGAGGNDAVQLTTNQTLNVINVIAKGGPQTVASLYGGTNSTTNTVNITNCIFLEATAGVDLGRYGISNPKSEVVLTSSVIYTSAAGAGPGTDSNGVLVRAGAMIIDHCDVINDGVGAASRGVITVDTTDYCDIKNSIIEGDAGVVGFAGTCVVSDSNVHGRTIQNYGFVANNVIDEWSPYAYIGVDTTNANFFKLYNNSVSRNHGSSPPIGSRGVSNISGVNEWQIF